MIYQLTLILSSFLPNVSPPDAMIAHNLKYGFQYYGDRMAAYKEYTSNKYSVPPVPSIHIKSENSGFIVDGVKYKTVDEWKNSASYRIMRETDAIFDSLDQLDLNTSNMLMRKYNKNRTIYDLNKINSNKASRGMKTILNNKQ